MMLQRLSGLASCAVMICGVIGCRAHSSDVTKEPAPAPLAAEAPADAAADSSTTRGPADQITANQLTADQITVPQHGAAHGDANSSTSENRKKSQRPALAGTATAFSSTSPTSPPAVGGADRPAASPPAAVLQATLNELLLSLQARDEPNPEKRRQLQQEIARLRQMRPTFYVPSEVP
jgi:hypothetical protein